MTKKVLSEEEIIDNQIIDLLMKKNKMTTASDVSRTINGMYGKLIQRLMDEEFDIFMGYDKNSHCEKEDENRRNGSSSKSKTVRTDNGEIQITTPRDRDGKFEPQIIKKRQRVLEGMDNLVISLYAKGNSLADIQDTIQELYSVKLSTETLSKMTKAVSEEVHTWQKRELKKCYTFVYIDCLYVHVKEDLKSVKKAVYVVIGVDTEGKKEVLGVWIDATESASKWSEIMEDLKERGVEDILFVCMDGLAGLPEAIEMVFPATIVQRCIVHITRNIFSITPQNMRKEVIADFKKIYTSSTLEKAKEAYKNFKEKYSDRKRITKKVDDNIEWIYQLFDFSPSIRKAIYTTNAIESVNSRTQESNER